MEFEPNDPRIIGLYEGSESGPLLLVFGGIHGNETAGIHALEEVFRLLEEEPLKNPGFRFKGTLIGLRGNMPAIEQDVRFIDKDLNRLWNDAHIENVLAADYHDLKTEDLELRDIVHTVRTAVTHYNPPKLVVMDIHTTSADGGIFSIVSDDPASCEIGTQLHAPVVLGMLEGIRGTTMTHFCRKHYLVDTVGVVFEAGKHDSADSVGNAVSAIINCMRTIGNVRPDDVEQKHDQRLIEFSKDLPVISRFICKHALHADDEFRMEPGYINFQKVKKGEILAHDVNGPVIAKEDALILMPFYQKQGLDGFFLIRPQNEHHCQTSSKA